MCINLFNCDFSDLFQECVWSATRRCMEPRRPAKLWGAFTMTAASPAAPVVSTHTHIHTHSIPSLSLLLSPPLLGRFTCKAHVTPWLISCQRPCSLELKVVPLSLVVHRPEQKHSYLGITVLYCWCLVSGCASHSSSPHKDTRKHFLPTWLIYQTIK